MNEVWTIIEAFDESQARGEASALATVVSVEGSAYRRPGARMLITSSGQTTGNISAGCLENDVIEHARRVIESGAAQLVEYDTASTSEEVVWGLGLGCNGIVRVLIEPLNPDSIYVEALRRSCESDAASVSVATIYQHTPSTTAAAQIETGARLFVGEDGAVRFEKLSDRVVSVLAGEMRALSQKNVPSGVPIFDVDGDTVKVFIETLLPPVPLVVFGAGYDALPVVEFARSLGWQTQVVDPQARPACRSRFSVADRVTLARPEEVPEQVSITPRTLTLLMSHNYSHDLEILRFLLASPAPYIGVMGPRRRTERMLSELAAGEEPLHLEGPDLSRLHSPAGLDIGANTPTEIALSIIAEMRAVLSARHGGMLRERRGTIYSTPVDGERVTLMEQQALPMALV